MPVMTTRDDTHLLSLSPAYRLLSTHPPSMPALRQIRSFDFLNTDPNPSSRPYTAATSAHTSFTRVDTTDTYYPFNAGSILYLDDSNTVDMQHDDDSGDDGVDKVPMTALTFLLVSGRRRTMSFDPETTILRVKDLAWNSWPLDWQDERPPAPSYLRILHLGRILGDEETLAQCNFPITLIPTPATPSLTSPSPTNLNPTTPTANPTNTTANPNPTNNINTNTNTTPNTTVNTNTNTNTTPTPTPTPTIVHLSIRAIPPSPTRLFGMRKKIRVKTAVRSVSSATSGSVIAGTIGGVGGGHGDGDGSEGTGVWGGEGHGRGCCGCVIA